MTQDTGQSVKAFVLSHKPQILAIAARHGAYNVRLFSSVAREEANARSDVDFLVDYELNKVSTWFPVGLVHDLEALLHLKIDVILADSVHPFIRDRVLQEATAL